ncbi:F0F1 ATP synthase subunit epsilon [Blattabacterium cuenoti]|uniref:F0F1 ATP synthase subunit epsilon n=1 Tax=Blattabacterium cuenoti TaxID=1653831 RepID=UPI00163C68DC|nr:F0F1 ATP synthase subunit epsilon [Blattabacterium cuenoti]
MDLKIIDQKKIVFQSNIVSIIVPGIDGYFQILENHTSFISLLKSGFLECSLKNSKSKKKIQIDSGILQVYKNNVLILL